MSRYHISLVFFASLWCAASFAQTKPPKALVIGNANYASLDTLAPSSIKDANGVADALRNLGVEVTVWMNLTSGTFEGKVADFAATLHPDDQVIFYFSGHGFSSDAENYLVPVDFTLTGTKTDLQARAMALSTVIAYLQMAKSTVVVLDACRDEPHLISVVTKGTTIAAYARLFPPQGSGSLVAFSTSAYKTASPKSSSGYSLYTKYLLDSLTQHPTDIRAVIYETKYAVAEASANAQVPGVYDEMAGYFSFSGKQRGGVTSGVNQTNSGAALPAGQQLTPDLIRASLRKNISTNTEFHGLHKWHIWSLWLALPSPYREQVSGATYTFDSDYLENPVEATINPSLGLANWRANGCTQKGSVKVEFKSASPITVSFDLCVTSAVNDVPQ